jgi:hypothetical protein
VFNSPPGPGARPRSCGRTLGPGTRLVQKQRYVSERALVQNPKTTRDLLDFDR